MTTAHRNWSRMLHRLWVLASVLWVLGLAFVAIDAEFRHASRMATADAYRRLGSPLPKGLAPIVTWSDTRQHVRWMTEIAIPVAVIGTGAPLGVLALGYALAWVIRGLRPDEPPRSN